MIFCGIDPSINSTGICVRENDIDHFYIVCPRHRISYDIPSNLEYVFYDKDTTKNEIAKTHNLINIADTIKKIIDRYDGEKHILMEGISYGSVRTSNICDLSGLNYLIRERLIGYDFTIASPSEIKKFYTGRGNANKQLVVDLFKAEYQIFNILNIKLDDIADSYAMMQLKRYMVEQKSTSPKG